ncbi:2-hydroxyacid dehydrogenase [Pararhodobacter oceanensis]|uniref:D-glycerate dehydrogenase n=1 Tax=Pararhodobacter oceanensis TaxID=2172121 RepID=A0A2T8HWL8_9RHOB|nr:D-glycerate dehydrogenase [Pararhodobacter oceanensis]PVH29798.1 D-glycerate dehydrogenase [Pararhodobacter oceanensis]
MRLLITRPLPDAVLDAARAEFDVTVRDSNLPMDHDEMLAALREFDVILPTLGDRFQAEVFAACPTPRAKLLANFGVGYNHIDVAAARAAGVAVSNTPGAVTDATADLALTLMLMTARRAAEGERLVRAGDWQGWHPTQLLGLHMSGKTLGIVGMGRIGQAIAKRAHFGFGMAIRYVTRSKRDLPELPEAQGMTDLHALMASSDIVVIAAPATPETHHMINAEALAAMQSHALLINIARGDIVDEAALIAALEARSIGGAGLDVYEFEPEVPARLIACENAVLLPHLGTNALEVRSQMGLMAVANALAHKQGRPLPNPV